MFKRWLIHILFLLPILLCVIGWAWSSCHSCYIEHLRGGLMLEAGTWSGNVAATWGRYYPGVPPDARPEGWRVKIYEQPVTIILPSQWQHFTLLGFDYAHEPGRAGYQNFTRLQVPYWFFIPLFSLLSYFAWRRTRPGKSDRAFPVVTKTLALLLLLAPFSACTTAARPQSPATQPIQPVNEQSLPADADDIDRLVACLSANGFWKNGTNLPLNLPATASVEEVISKLYLDSFWWRTGLSGAIIRGPITRHDIVQVKKVRISSLPYIAVRVDTYFGK